MVLSFNLVITVFNSIVALIAIGALLTAVYFSSSAFDGIRYYLPAEFRGDGIYRLHIRQYAFSASVPIELQKKYFYGSVFAEIFGVCVILFVAQSQNYVLMALIFVAVVAGAYEILLNRRQLKISVDSLKAETSLPTDNKS